MSFLENLKVGDRVQIYSHGFPSFPKITGETAKYWKIGYRRFRKSDGKEAGASFIYLREFSQATYDHIRDLNEIKSLRNEISELMKNATLDQARKIKEILVKK